MILQDQTNKRSTSKHKNEKHRPCPARQQRNTFHTCHDSIGIAVAICYNAQDFGDDPYQIAYGESRYSLCYSRRGRGSRSRGGGRRVDFAGRRGGSSYRPPYVPPRPFVPGPPGSLYDCGRPGIKPVRRRVLIMCWAVLPCSRHLVGTLPRKSPTCFTLTHLAFRVACCPGRRSIRRYSV
jgi:hypothetical protein